MRYADTLLIEGEQVALRTRQHWLAFLVNSRYGLALWALALALIGVALALQDTIGQAGFELIGYIVLGLLAIGLLIVLIELWQWWAQDYMITNRRLMKVWGVLNKRSVDSALEKVNDARLDQSVFGRIFNYGHLDILTASTETELDDYDMIKDPKGFKRTMLTQKHALEMSFFQGSPSPPLRASMDTTFDQPIAPQPPMHQAEPTPPPVPESTPPPVPEPTPPPAPEPVPPAPAEAASPPAEAATPPAEPGDRALEITQTLARLADLRDRGAITEQEYEAKKQELLGRL